MPSTPSESPIHLPRGSKRPFTADGNADVENRRKDPKVSRACDHCKTKKVRCNGTLPCENCTRRKLVCAYDAKYARGRPPTPLRSTVGVTSPSQNECSRESGSRSPRRPSEIMTAHSEITSRISPELEIEQQYFDPTSGLTFLHRAWQKVFMQKQLASSHGASEADKCQFLTSAGDRPFRINGQTSLYEVTPDDAMARSLLAFYFDTCVVTYRMLHRPTSERWMAKFLDDRNQNRPVGHSLGNAKCTILLTIMAIATFRYEKVNRTESSDEAVLRQGDQLFCAGLNLTDTEKGFPRLESAQARLMQVLYLLQTSRMNKGWYTFGNAFHITSSLGLHRRRDNKRNVSWKDHQEDYVTLQCCKRTFWVAYTIDKYLSVVFGRPRLYHDEDIDQDFPDRVNDEDITVQGPLESEVSGDCHIDSLIFHAKIARIIGKISREVYSVGNMPNHERVAAAHRLGHELHEWRASLPLHLGSIKPSTLIPSFRRQAVALQLAYSHAIIHAYRPFLPGGEFPIDTSRIEESIAECIAAAKATLNLVDTIAEDNNLFHSFWWTQYVTFCALTVVYVWGIQRGKNCFSLWNNQSYDQLFNLAERCRSHLVRATSGASPNRRYNMILEELRLEAQRQTKKPDTHFDQMQSAGSQDGLLSPEIPGFGPELIAQTEDFAMADSLNAWQITDWLDLDSSAFHPYIV